MIKAAPVGEHSGIVELSMAQSRLGDPIQRGVGMTPKVPETPGPWTSVTKKRMLCALFGGTTRGGHHQRGICGALLDYAAEQHRWRRKLFAVKRHGGVIRTHVPVSAGRVTSLSF